MMNDLKRNLKKLLLVGFCLCFWLMQEWISKGQTINLAGDVWAPYVMDPANGRKGFMVEIAELAFKKAGYTLNFKIVPWSRTLSEVEKGNYDGALGIYFDQANQYKFIIALEEIGVSVNRFYVKKESNWRYHGKPSLKSINVGIIADYNYGELNNYILQQKNANSSSVEIISGNGALEKNIRKLLNGRIQAIIEDEIVVGYFIRKLGYTDLIKEAGIVPPSNKVGVAFSPKNPRSNDYAKILSDGVREMRKSGELKAILDKYYVKDWK